FQIKASFGINHFQVKYFDEDNEEVRDRVPMLLFWLGVSSVINSDLIYLIFQICINSQGEKKHLIACFMFHFMFPRRGDRTVRKAERQRLKAERRQLRAEVKEIKKKLRLEKRGLQWSGPSTSGRKPGLFSTMLCTLETRGPGVSHTSLVPTMAALFLDENLPDGTNLEPGTKFIKYWKMKNTGSICWTSETKLVFMWGNLSLASEEKREVPVPLLPPGHVGMVSVALVAPVTEGTYTSHWRLAHCGSQFGPRVWCSIVVKQRDKYIGFRHQRKRLKDLKPVKKEVKPEEKEVRSKGGFLAGLFPEDYYFPPVDFMTAQDLLSFELLDLNFTDDLEKVPHNTPEDLTPCISPLPYCTVVIDKASPSPKKEDTEVSAVRKLFGETSRVIENIQSNEERDEEISGAQFLCETVMRSLTLEEAPDHRPPRRPQHCCHPPKGEEPKEKEEGRSKREDWDEVSSQTSSVSSDDYIVILPDCFDTSRPLGESMYISAMSQPGTTAATVSALTEVVAAEDSLANTGPPPVAQTSSMNQMLSASQTVDAVVITPEVVPFPDPLLPPPALYSPRLDGREGVSDMTRGITEGLVKGALSVAASAYKALFTGPSSTRQGPSKMDMLLEMGFRDQRLNRRLLKKHLYSLEHTVDELVQLAENRRNRDNVILE
uniref:NBR1 autophagy cargo receptor a n=1 Tax=Amphilophus citrinellus TaxID=61819 RepID=A0A3Q0S3B2_AMPCI